MAFLFAIYLYWHQQPPLTIIVRGICYEQTEGWPAWRRRYHPAPHSRVVEARGCRTRRDVRYPPRADGAYPEIRHYTDYYEMMANEELDILDIALPTYLHAQYAEDALIVLVAQLYAAAAKNSPVCGTGAPSPRRSK